MLERTFFFLASSSALFFASSSSFLCRSSWVASSLKLFFSLLDYWYFHGISNICVNIFHYRYPCLSVPLFFSPYTLLLSSFCPPAFLHWKKNNNSAALLSISLNGDCTLTNPFFIQTSEGKIDKHAKQENSMGKGITILALSPINSSSSFFLCSKWTSISVCSSRRSFSILFLWIS